MFFVKGFQTDNAKLSPTLPLLPSFFCHIYLNAKTMFLGKMGKCLLDCLRYTTY